MSENLEQNGECGFRGRMTGLQYEALCRHAISRIYGVGIGEIRGGYLAGASNNRRTLRHQIDLYWDTSDGLELNTNGDLRAHEKAELEALVRTAELSQIASMALQPKDKT